MTVGKNILDLRRRKGISQEDLANLLLISRQTVSQWENDQTLPSIDNLLRLKEIFGVSVDKMLSTEEIKALPINTDSLDTLCAALAYAMGIDAPKYAAQKNGELVNYIDKVFDGEKADRVVMYNPDAIAQWIYQKYPEYLSNVKANTDKEIYLSTVMPSVTPVCFGTMYTGAQPYIHGIQKYEKPVILLNACPLIQGGFSTTPENLSKMKDIFIAEWQKMGTEGISEKELRLAKNYLQSSYNLRFADITVFSAILAQMQNENLGIDFLQKRNQYIENVTLERVNLVAKKYFSPEKLIMINLGKTK